MTKYPRSGRPAKKLFRFSFVEGKIYLTWKGKFGNQGVDLGEVREMNQCDKERCSCISVACIERVGDVEFGRNVMGREVARR